MNSLEVKKFADLARIEISETDLAKMAKEIEAVLEYVGQIKNAISSETERRIESASVRNVYREDENSHERAVNKNKILESAPDRDGDYIKVKKIM